MESISVNYNQFANTAVTGAKDTSSQPSLLQSLSETRNIMSQFTVPESTATSNLQTSQTLPSFSEKNTPSSQDVPLSSLPHYLGLQIMSNRIKDPQLLQATIESLAASGKATDNAALRQTQPLTCNQTAPQTQSFKQEATLAPQTLPFKQEALQDAKLMPGTGVSAFNNAVVKSEPSPMQLFMPSINESLQSMINSFGVNQNRKAMTDIVNGTGDIGPNALKCTVCQETFDTQDKLGEHLNMHANETPALCTHCNKAFHNKQSLDYHMLTHNNDKSHICEVCSKAFLRKEHLRRHMQTHSNEKPYECDVCHKTFRSHNNFVNHVMRHGDPANNDGNDNISNSNNVSVAKRRSRQQHNCTACNAVFSTKSAYNAHMLEHTGRKPYQCDKCDKCFNDKSSLCRHSMVHTGEKPYGCEHCDKCFARRDHLQRHTLTHTGQKPHQCKLCPRWFKLKRDLVAHMEEVHSGEANASAMQIPEVSGKPSRKRKATANATVKPVSSVGAAEQVVMMPPISPASSTGLQAASHAGFESAIINVTPLSNPEGSQARSQVTATAVLPNPSGNGSFMTALAANTADKRTNAMQQLLQQVALPAAPAQAPADHVILAQPLAQLINQLSANAASNNVTSSVVNQFAMGSFVNTQPMAVPMSVPMSVALNLPAGLSLPVTSLAAGLGLPQQQTGQAPLQLNLFNTQAAAAVTNTGATLNLPGISTVMSAQQHAPVANLAADTNIGGSQTSVKVETGVAPSMPQLSFTMPTKAEQLLVNALPVSMLSSKPVVKQDTNGSFLTSNNNVYELGMSDTFTSTNDVISQAFAMSQKGTTDGDIYGQVENTGCLTDYKFLENSEK